MGNHYPTFTPEQQQKLDEGKPVYLQNGVSIRKNPDTGKL